jgi:hypothetical protein
MVNKRNAAGSEGKAAKKTAARRSRGADSGDGESAVLAKIAALAGPYRAMGERLHAIIRASAPELEPKVWYGMPGYARDGKCVCFFRADKYLTLGFTFEASFFDDGGRMQPSAFALRELTADEEAKIAELVKRAVKVGTA